MPITGECFCGKVKYQITAPLSPANFCHCSRCRKAFSSNSSAFAAVNPNKFQWTSGEKLLTSYLNKDGIGLQFCKICGSTLAGVAHGKVMGITLGCLNGNPKIKLGQHIYTGSKASWDVIPNDGAPRFEEGK